MPGNRVVALRFALLPSLGVPAFPWGVQKGFIGLCIIVLLVNKCTWVHG